MSKARAPLTTTGAFNKSEPKPISTAKSTGPRTGKKAIPFWVPAAAKKQLDYMTVDLDTTQQALLSTPIFFVSFLPE